MSEILSERPLHEILRPDVTPEMGFQSYEMLGSASGQRSVEEKSFLSGEIRNPQLDYPLFDEVTLTTGIRNLQTILSRAQSIADPGQAAAVWDSASYRMAEMYWLRESQRLNSMSDRQDSGAFEQSAQRYQELNEQLYGKPDKIIASNVFGEVIAQARDKELHPSAELLLNELEYGSTVMVAGEEMSVRGIGDLAEGRLPKVSGPRLDTLREVLLEDFADTIQLVDQYWDEVVMKREAAAGKEPGFNVNDMHALFTTLRDMRDPENAANISIVIDETFKMLAWDTPTMSVRIGAGRAAITEKPDMVAKMIHEYGVHGVRAVNGLKSKLPVLGTGLFTDADSDERTDYLTFEEGLGSLCEIAIDQSVDKWKPMHVSRYMAAALAYEGADFRESFEVNWRARVLMAVGPGQPATPELIAKERKQAYISTVRLKRGTPTDATQAGVLTFNKDLAYLHGKLDGLRYLETVGDNKQEVRRLFLGKYDPLNSRQKALADQYL